MNHAVAIEEVMPRDRLKQRVSVVSEVNSINAIKDGARDSKSVTDRLLRDGSEISSNLNVMVGNFRKRLLELARYQDGLHHVQGKADDFLQKISL